MNPRRRRHNRNARKQKKPRWLKGGILRVRRGLMGGFDYNPRLGTVQYIDMRHLTFRGIPET